jgi:hypothetical protein
MAGKRQHILPRFLLKGFASKVQGENIFAWVYRKGSRPFETKIENISVEKHFYGKEGELSADDEITSLEGGYAYLIDTLRGKKDGTQVSDPEVANFVAHLSIRTKHLRESFRESTEYLLEQFADYLSDFNNFKTLVLSNPKLVREELVKLLKDIPVPDWQKGMLLEVMELYGPALMNEQQPEIEKIIRGLFEEVKSVLPKAFKEGHIKSLAKNPSPKPRADEYGGLKGFVHTTKSSLILGDTGCLFEVVGERRFKPIDDKGDKITNIFLPIASRKLLVGTSFSAVPNLDIKTLNKAIAKCSYEYFVCSESSSDKEALSSTIGMWAGILSKKEMEQLLSEIINDVESGAL